MAKAATTKQRIERAALKLFVARGVAKTTTRDIAAAAGIAEGTIYRHFASKQQLAGDLFVAHHVALAQALEEAHKTHKSLSAKTRAIVIAWCAAADADWLAFSYYLLRQHGQLASIKADLPNPVTVVRSVIVAAMHAQETPKRDVDIVLAMVLGVVLQPAIHKVYGRIEGRLAPHAELLAEAACKVLGCGK